MLKKKKMKEKKKRTKARETERKGKLPTSTTPASVGEGFESLNPTRLWGIWLKTGSLKIDKALPSVTPACNAGGWRRPIRQRRPPPLYVTFRFFQILRHFFPLPPPPPHPCSSLSSCYSYYCFFIS